MFVLSMRLTVAAFRPPLPPTKYRAKFEIMMDSVEGIEESSVSLMEDKDKEKYIVTIDVEESDDQHYLPNGKHYKRGLASVVEVEQVNVEEISGFPCPSCNARSKTKNRLAKHLKGHQIKLARAAKSSENADKQS